MNCILPNKSEAFTPSADRVDLFVTKAAVNDELLAETSALFIRIHVNDMNIMYQCVTLLRAKGGRRINEYCKQVQMEYMNLLLETRQWNFFHVFLLFPPTFLTATIASCWSFV